MWVNKWLHWTKSKDRTWNNLNQNTMLLVKTNFTWNCFMKQCILDNAEIFPFFSMDEWKIVYSNKYMYVKMSRQIGYSSGDTGYQSQYLSHAKRALYHLSYTPLLPSYSHMFVSMCFSFCYFRNHSNRKFSHLIQGVFVNLIEKKLSSISRLTCNSYRLGNKEIIVGVKLNIQVCKYWL